MGSSPAFLLITCQAGAESALKAELARKWPAFRFAYSRPGFVTFRLPEGANPPDGLDLDCVFARASALSLGKVTGATVAERVAAAWTLFGGMSVDTLHVWPRDAQEPGQHGYEPGVTTESQDVADALLLAAPDAFRGRSQPGVTDASNGLAADLVIVQPDEWWAGYHRVHSVESSWPGGLFPETLPEHAVSRVYLKIREALAWSRFPVKRGDRVAEIGCAPGGSTQALLELGAHVLGIDPAEMAPVVAGHPRFRHIRRRSKETPRREFVGIDWLTCDINLPPNYTLDTVEAIVAHPGVQLRGMLLTLKLIDWSLAAQIPEFIARVESWGFGSVRVRQLHHNRREVCLCAARG